MTDQPKPDDTFSGKYVLWINNNTEGWTPYAQDTLADCYAQVIDYATRKFRITHPPIIVELSEVKARA